MLDQAGLNSLPQRLGERECHKIALECCDILAEVGGVAVGAGGVDAAQTASIHGRFGGAVSGLNAGCGGTAEHARDDRAVVDLHVGVR